MLNRLRWQLTLLYLLAAFGLILVVGGGAYTMIRLYFLESTDLALEYKMATLFSFYGFPMPTELASAEDRWLEQNAFSLMPGVSIAQFTPVAPLTEFPSSEEDEYEHRNEEMDEDEYEREEYYEAELYDGRLSAIFVLPLTDEGILISYPNMVTPPFPEDSAARTAALVNGSDRRTTILENGSRVRLLTYHASDLTNPSVIQIGRLLNDQDQLLNQLGSSFLLLSAASLVVLGCGSWWLSGRSIIPAQKAWDQQQVFISNASHELRTPLTLIRASAEYVLRNSNDQEQQALLEDVLNESDYMTRLVEDLLLLSRLDTQRLQLEQDHVDLTDLLMDVHSRLKKLADSKQVELILENAQGTVLGDRTRLRQVLLILLDNALRFTPARGKIWLEALPQDKNVIISVKDNGSGIEPKHLPHLFDRFYQASNGNEEFRGNGLGLAIAKGLIEAQGGAISIDSQLRIGTQVTLSFPRIQ